MKNRNLKLKNKNTVNIFQSKRGLRGVQVSALNIIIYIYIYIATLMFYYSLRNSYISPAFCIQRYPALFFYKTFFGKNTSTFSDSKTAKKNWILYTYYISTPNYCAVAGGGTGYFHSIWRIWVLLFVNNTLFFTIYMPIWCWFSFLN